MNSSVTVTAVRDAMRSADWILKTTADTCPTMCPEETAIDCNSSAEVCTVTSSEPGVTAPLVRPDMVTRIALEADILAAAVVKMTELELVALLFAVNPGKLV